MRVAGELAYRSFAAEEAVEAWVDGNALLAALLAEVARDTAAALSAVVEFVLGRVQADAGAGSCAALLASGRVLRSFEHLIRVRGLADGAADGACPFFCAGRWMVFRGDARLPGRVPGLHPPPPSPPPLFDIG